MDQIELLSYADGELNSPETAAIDTHLAGCAECRLRLAELRSDIGELIARHRERKSAAACPASSWADLTPEFDRLDRRKRPAFVIPSLPVPAWIGVAAAALFAVVVWNLSTHGTVNAAELLQKASSRHAASEPNRRIVIKTRRQNFVRAARLTASAEPKTAARDTAMELRQRFEQANFSWDDPLNPASFARWRVQLPDKQDHVSVIEPGGGISERVYLIRTTTSHGVLPEATLAMRVTDLHAVRETLRFQDDEWVEIAETASADLGNPNVLPVPGPRIAAEPASSSDPVIDSGHSVGPAEELRVLAALNRIGADLGEPIEVRRDDGQRRVAISGLGIDAGRQQQIRDAVRGLPGVTLEFSQPQPVETPAREPVAPVTAAQRSALHSQIEARIGAGERVEQFIDRLVKDSESALARAHALKNLATRFPPDVEQVLAPEDKRILEDLRMRHISALLSLTETIERQITEAFDSTPEAPVSSCTVWQHCTASVLASSQKFDQVLNSVLAEAGARQAADPAVLKAVLAGWRRQVAGLARAAAAN
jgi:hypothetical protein